MRHCLEWRGFVRFAASLLCLFSLSEGLGTAQVRSVLKIVVVEGEGAINNLQLGSTQEPVVEIRDENDVPVAGAIVTFSVPERGPGGSFFGAGSNLTVTTNELGRATGSRFRQNSTEGRFLIHVTAALGSRIGAANISQTNVRDSESITRVRQADKKFGKGKLIAILAGGAIAGAVVAAHGGDSATNTVQPTTITPGTVSVGTPR